MNAPRVVCMGESSVIDPNDRGFASIYTEAGVTSGFLNMVPESPAILLLGLGLLGIMALRGKGQITSW